MQIQLKKRDDIRITICTGIIKAYTQYIEKMNLKNRKKKNIENKVKGTFIKLPQNGGLFSEKLTILFTQTLNMFCLADNIYFNQIK